MSYIKALTTEQHGVISCVHLATPEQDTLSYLSCEAAIASGAVEVREVSEGGSVNSIEVVNGSEAFVFMMDGDLLEGAKQTRVLNTSVYLAPKSRTVLPVSCVEQGRWQYTSRSFTGSRHVAPRSVRARKSADVAFSLRSGRRHVSDQGAVWNEVHSLDERFRVASRTTSLADTYAHLETDIDTLLASFKGDPEANGFAVLVGRQLLGVDIFNRRDVCATYLPKVLRAVAIEAMFLGPDTPMPRAPEASFHAVDFLDRIEAIPTERHPGVALGDELRFDTAQATGFRLEYESALLHYTAMVLEKTGEEEPF